LAVESSVSLLSLNPYGLFKTVLMLNYTKYRVRSCPSGSGDARYAAAIGRDRGRKILKMIRPSDGTDPTATTRQHTASRRIHGLVDETQDSNHWVEIGRVSRAMQVSHSAPRGRQKLLSKTIIPSRMRSPNSRSIPQTSMLKKRQLGTRRRGAPSHGTGVLLQLQQGRFLFRLNKLSACRLAPRVGRQRPNQTPASAHQLGLRSVPSATPYSTSGRLRTLVILGADANPPAALFATARNCVGRTG